MRTPGSGEVTVGVGADIVCVERIERLALQRGDRALNRLFTPGERSYCEAQKRIYASYAARFAAKEAVAKALGSGFRGFSFRDVEIVSGPGGRPQVVLHNGAASAAAGRGVARVLVSLSHDGAYAAAFAVATGRADGLGKTCL